MNVNVTTHAGRTLDYIPRLVDANRPYRVAPASGDLMARSRYWVPGREVLDQGREGACVGFAVVGEAMATPVRLNWGPYRRDSATSNDLMARYVYRQAQRIDEWEGENYEGTSVRAGMLVGRDEGWWAGFRWAFNLLELRTALEEGPVVVGVEWREGMYTTDKWGRVHTTGRVVGGHALLITGYSPNYYRGGPTWRWRNSWSTSYGRNGSGYIKSADLDAVLYQAGGEAAVPIGRTA